jgi:hypothetical protein
VKILPAVLVHMLQYIPTTGWSLLSKRKRELYWYRAKIDPIDPSFGPLPPCKLFSTESDLYGEKLLAHNKAVDLAKQSGIKHCFVSFIQIFPDDARRERDYDAREIRAFEVRGSQAETCDRDSGVKPQSYFFPELFKFEQ